MRTQPPHAALLVALLAYVFAAQAVQVSKASMAWVQSRYLESASRARCRPRFFSTSQQSCLLYLFIYLFISPIVGFSMSMAPDVRGEYFIGEMSGTRGNCRCVDWTGALGTHWRCHLGLARVDLKSGVLSVDVNDTIREQ